MSPAKIWIGATSAAIHIAIENILRAPGLARSFSRCHAPTPPTTKRRRQIGGDHGVDEAIGKAGVEDDRQPAVARHELPARVDREAHRRLHPAVDADDPGRRDQRAERDHAGGEEMQPLADLGSCRTASRPGTRPRGRRRSALHRPSAARSPARPCPRTPTSWCRTDRT